MADLKIRDVDDHLVQLYRQRAEANGISLEEELRRSLAELVRRERQDVLARLKEHQEKLRAKYGVMPDSTPGIRAERDGEPDV